MLCIFSVEFFDNVAKIDDPVGAVSVHCMNGAWGTIAVGLFATEGGLFYGGGFAKLGIQLLGIVSVAAWVLATMFIIFTVIKKTIGLRVSEKEEIDGLALLCARRLLRPLAVGAVTALVLVGYFACSRYSSALMGEAWQYKMIALCYQTAALAKPPPPST